MREGYLTDVRMKDKKGGIIALTRDIFHDLPRCGIYFSRRTYRGEENEKSNSVSTANGVATSLWDSRLLFCRNVYLYVVFAL